MRFDKLDSALLRIWRDYRRGGAERVARHAELWGVILPEAEGEPVRVVVSITGESSEALQQLDPRWQVSISTESGPSHSAILPLEHLEAMCESPSVKRVVLARRHRVKVDVASRAVRLPAFRQLTRSSGRDVVVGIIDTGIDISHPALAGRVDAIWDQEAGLPNVPDARNPRNVLCGSDMALSRDEDGHGTHVTGIAAAVAPEAHLVVVKSPLDDESVKQGILFIMNTANDLHLPAVVNLSIGSHIHAHDGTDDLSLFVDGASGRGRIVCCAAGNEGDVDIHARFATRRGYVRPIEFCVEEADSDDRSVILVGYYPARRAISVGIESPGGHRTGMQSAPKLGEAFDDEWDLGGVRAWVSIDPRTQGGLRQFLIELSGGDLKGTWKLLATGPSSGTSDIHAWIVDSEDSSSFVGEFADPCMRISSPGTSRLAVTVGNFTTCSSWRTEAGEPAMEDDLEVGTLDSSSSDGPLLDGHRKPDIVAPGSMIVSARSSHADPDPHLDISPRLRIMGGTSMASPFVAGIVALMLQHTPTATPDEVRKMLSSSAAIPGRRAHRFNRRWGYGLIRLLSDDSHRKTSHRRKGRRPTSPRQSSAAGGVTTS